MTISSRFQRRGIGSRLLEQLRDHAKKHGLREIYLGTTQYQTAAVALYKKAGFKIVKDLPLVGMARIFIFKLDL
jgi:ribosomal protein S18 acetylase RimI-like enzyme